MNGLASKVAAGEVIHTHPYCRMAGHLCLYRADGAYIVAEYDQTMQQPGALLHDAKFLTYDAALERLIAEVRARRY